MDMNLVRFDKNPLLTAKENNLEDVAVFNPTFFFLSTAKLMPPIIY